MKRLSGLIVAACLTAFTVGAQGMMGGGYGYGVPGAGPYGGYPGMMGGGYGGSYGGCGYDDGSLEAARSPMTIDDAKVQADKYLASWADANLAISEIMEFDNQFYVAFAEKDSGVGAFEMLMDKYTGTMTPEPGPDMMWNLKYGMMARGATPTDSRKISMPVTIAQADADAQKYLDSYNQGYNSEIGGDSFYGYYTIHVLKDGKIIGMLGVNGYTGQVWYHGWHGTYFGMKSFG
ncbi:MAG TPA: hypothetical protein VMV83_02670 [Rectinemataceae bacterium]|nr:hypothetical protein [Rectinemataceae bacterium]